MTSFTEGGIFGGIFGRGAARTGDDAWLQAMLDAEAALARAAERAGLAPPGSGAAVTAIAHADLFDNGALGAAAATTGNPVPALIKAMTAELTPSAPETARAIHVGATSQDIIDTAAMLLAASAIDATLPDLFAAARSCARLAADHATTVMSGRTLLQQAVPVTFGLVAAGWLTAIDDATAALRRIRSARLAIQYGGAAGTLAPLGDSGPAVAELFAEELGLAVPVLPWHTDRLRIIELSAALTGACAALGKIARDVTLLAQTEVAEVRESPAEGRGGSSTMPHKQNPVAAIAVLACAKQAPGLLATLAAAAEQEHQRAAGAWHAEWQPLTTLLQLTSTTAAWSAELLAGLQVDPARMRANLNATGGLPLAEHVATVLAPELGRQQAHALVEQAARHAAAHGTTLADALAEAGIDKDQIARALLPDAYLGAAQQFIDRALTAHEAISGA